MRTQLYYATLCLIGLVAAKGVAQDKSNVDEHILGSDDSRMKLSSGVFRVAGKTVHTVRGKSTTTDENCIVTFDYDKGCYRFERGGERTFLQTPECYYERWTNAPGTTQASITQYELHEPPIVRVNPFDIRDLGFFTCHGSYYKSKYDSFRQYLLKETRVIEKTVGPLASITVTSNQANDSNQDQYVTYRIWVDKEKGYTTTRIEANAFQVSEMSWSKLNGVFVPVSFRQRYNSVSSGLRIEADWALTWESVNEAIPESHFTYQSLKKETDDSAVLYSKNADETGKPVALDIFGVKPNLTPSPVVPASSTNFSQLLVLNGVILILLAITYSVSRYVHSRTARK